MKRLLPLVLVIVAGCAPGPPTAATGGGGPTAVVVASTPTPTAAAVASTAAASPTPDLLELSKEAYQALADKDGPALDAASQALQSTGASLRQQRAALAQLADAEATYESDLSTVRWPPSLTPKTDAVIAATDKFARLALGAASSTDPLAISAALPALSQAELDQGAAIAVLKAALGLP